MTYYEKYQKLVDDVTTKAIEGIVPVSCAMKVQKSFEEWKAKTSITLGSKEAESIVYKCKSN
jgi:hypothetical protein